jgi:hypothetical protein
MELIHVCGDATDPSTAARELLALEEAAAMFPGTVRRLLTLTADAVPAEVPPGVIAQPAYEWMLALPEKR